MMENYAMFKIMNSKYSSHVVDRCLMANEVMVYRVVLHSCLPFSAAITHVISHPDGNARSVT